MATFDGKLVSQEWFVVLSAARRDGVYFRLNSGRRTMAQQKALYDNYRRNGWPVAAYPNPNAPHIREGRIDHALDVNDEDGYASGGGADNLRRWAARKGFTLVRTVRGEPWHLEIVGGGDALRRFAARVKARPNPIRFTKPERRIIHLIRAVRKRKSTAARRAAIRGYKLVIRGLREAIRRAAKRSGWNRNDRKRRYDALLKVYNGG